MKRDIIVALLTINIFLIVLTIINFQVMGKYAMFSSILGCMGWGWLYLENIKNTKRLN